MSRLIGNLTALAFILVALACAGAGTVKPAPIAPRQDCVLRGAWQEGSRPGEADRRQTYATGALGTYRGTAVGFSKADSLQWKAGTDSIKCKPTRGAVVYH